MEKTSKYLNFAYCRRALALEGLPHKPLRPQRHTMHHHPPVLCHTYSLRSPHSAWRVHAVLDRIPPLVPAIPMQRRREAGKLFPRHFEAKVTPYVGDEAHQRIPHPWDPGVAHQQGVEFGSYV